MPAVKDENVAQMTDLEGVRHDFLAINGFDIPGVDYEKDVTDLESIDA
jgi:enoyl-[acyl-carrier protein] reductase/trans-2-enoyl-CoA reductase (NAD+)